MDTLDWHIDAIVCDQIKRYRETSQGFPNATTLGYVDYSILVQILLQAFKLEPSDVESCRSYLQNNIGIITQLDSAYASNTFGALRSLFSSNDFRPAPVMDIGPVPLSRSANNSNKSQSLKDVFELPYKGNLPQLFKKTLNENARSMFQSAAQRAYNRSVAIVQSSGMGKSRLVDETSNLLFGIPLNLRETINQGTLTYPPADKHLRAYFNHSENKSDEFLQVEHVIFLSTLFDCVTPMAEKFKEGRTAVKQAIEWAAWLKEGQTAEAVGPNRSRLYRDVVEKARSKLVVLADPQILKALSSALRQSWVKLRKALVPEDGRHNADNMCFVYFDEAHGLTKPPAEVGPLCRMSSYHNLCKVLAKLCDAPIFFIFLWTNSNLRQFAPPVFDHPSLRVSQGYAVFPPFTELPFDVFVETAMEKLAQPEVTMSLTNVCTTDIMSHFGRPMWLAHQQLRQRQQQLQDTPMPLNETVNDVFQFALDKMSAHGNAKKSDASGLAAIGVRVSITFDSRNQSSRMMETQLVESHMRVVYAIPEHRKYMRTGSPSEPILAEAAGRYLSQLPGKIMEAGPKILAESCREGVVARGERGELCGRLLLTIAHDLAIPKGLDSVNPQYHRPIPVVDFLRALFAESHHDTVLRATPINSDPSTIPGNPLALGKVFENAYVSFSHFDLVHNSEMLGASLLQYSLIRGCAIQINQGQASIDAVIPIHMGGVTDPITTQTMSAINVQFRNLKDVQYCAIDRSVTVPDVGQPAITIVFELGDESPLSPHVQVDTLREGQAQNPLDDLHYQLVARGHGPETFNVVSARTKDWYDIILGTGDIMGDFPRANEPESVAYVKQMMPLRVEHVEKYLAAYATAAKQLHNKTVE
ncbi:putative G2/mitotic-specific cyclin cdc13 [Rhizoctonia solani 123E]|uniref:Putative G2/mitotic-specific cyclin cdc13 n=2 Tax=Rhizoctonia solani AG-3 TaxID=1086053 RepID=A0A074S955_9AGAM|nr:putative G2/mitotic-specific cyclin cdc13 [Rhizoctonia solani 123E]